MSQYASMVGDPAIEAELKAALADHLRTMEEVDVAKLPTPTPDLLANLLAHLPPGSTLTLTLQIPEAKP